MQTTYCKKKLVVRLCSLSIKPAEGGAPGGRAWAVGESDFINAKLSSASSTHLRDHVIQITIEQNSVGKYLQTTNC